MSQENSNKPATPSGKQNSNDGVVVPVNRISTPNGNDGSVRKASPPIAPSNTRITCNLSANTSIKTANSEQASVGNSSLPANSAGKGNKK